MEDLYPKLSDSLKKVVEIVEDEDQLLIKLRIKNEDLIPGDLGSPAEVQEMIRIFGGVSQEISMDVHVDQKTNLITIKLLNKQDFKLVRSAIRNIWDRAAKLLEKALIAEPGKTDEFRKLGDFDETY